MGYYHGPPNNIGPKTHDEPSLPIKERRDHDKNQNFHTHTHLITNNSLVIVIGNLYI